MSATRKSSSPLAVVVVVLLLASQPGRAQPLPKEPMAAQSASQPEEPLAAAASEEKPMVHNDNYDMIMPDYYDQHPAESMHYQNFEEFYDPNMTGTNEYKMDESQFKPQTMMVRAPMRQRHGTMRMRPMKSPSQPRVMRVMRVPQVDYAAFGPQPGMMRNHRYG